MAAPPTPPRGPRRSSPGAAPWLRDHLTAVIAAAGGAAILIVLLVVVIGSVGSGGGSKPIAPGTLVGTGPLSTGYRVTGTVKKRGDAMVVIAIDQVETVAAEARNVVIRPGAVQEFDRPVDGTVALSRNGRMVATPAKFHVGDKVTLVGQFTAVDAPPGAPHDGYAFIAIEAASG